MWHAKRMRMATKWGMRLPVHSNDKGVRAWHRAAARHCTVHDASYRACFELRGQRDDILGALGRLADPSDATGFAHAQYRDGSRWGSCMLHEPDAFPWAPIAPVQFHWRPSTAPSPSSLAPARDSMEGEDAREEHGAAGSYGTQYDEADAVVWVWVHPAATDIVRASLRAVTMDTLSSDDMATTDHDHSVVLTDLRSEVLRFQLRGPRSTEVLLKLLLRGNTELALPNVLPETTAAVTAARWSGVVDAEAAFRTMFLDAAGSTFSSFGSGGSGVSGGSGERDKTNRLFQAQTPDQFAPRVVVEMRLRDPRIDHTSSSGALAGEEGQDAVPERKGGAGGGLSLWAPADRLDARDRLPSTAAVNAMRHDTRARDLRGAIHTLKRDLGLGGEGGGGALASSAGRDVHMRDASGNTGAGLPGSAGSPAACAPIILAQVPSPDSFDGAEGRLGSGWDIIVPARWGMVVWMELIIGGGRAVGLDAVEDSAIEGCVPSFPRDFPDTAAGQQYAREARRAAMQGHLGREVGRRVNYATVLGDRVLAASGTPYGVEWSRLWGGASADAETRKTDADGGDEKEQQLAMEVAAAGEDDTSGEGGGWHRGEEEDPLIEESMDEGGRTEETFCVVRNRKYLDLLLPPPPPPPPRCGARRKDKGKGKGGGEGGGGGGIVSSDPTAVSAISAAGTPPVDTSCAPPVIPTLISVVVTSINKGVPTTNARIWVPSAQDWGHCVSLTSAAPLSDLSGESTDRMRTESRGLAGFVSSACSSLLRGGRGVGVGLCEAAMLQNILQDQWWGKRAGPNSRLVAASPLRRGRGGRSDSPAPRPVLVMVQNVSAPAPFAALLTLCGDLSSAS
jgi:hypothetical protein